MPDLSVQAIRTWRRGLPPDVAAVVTDDVGGDEVRIRTLVDRLTAAPLAQAAGILREYDADVAAMGRSGRVRLLAWLAARIGGDAQIRDVLQVFEEDDEESGSSDSRPSSCRLFYEDVKLLMKESFGPRVAKRELEPSALDLVTRSSMAASMRTGPAGGAP